VLDPETFRDDARFALEHVPIICTHSLHAGSS
jgi:hypothetical protein